MLNWLKPQKRQRDKLPLFLGDLAVVPRSNFHQFLEDGWKSSETDTTLKEWIAKSLELPLQPQHAKHKDEFLALDVLVGGYAKGACDFINIGSFGLPLIWRPYVKLNFRLREGHNKSVLGTHIVKKKMPWGEYFNNYFSTAKSFGLHRALNDDDLKHLVLLGLLEGVLWAKQQVTT